MRTLKLKTLDSPSKCERIDPNDIEDIKKHIRWRIYNKKVFHAMDMDNIAHRDFMDLTMAYDIREVSKDRNYVNEYLLTNDDVENLGLTDTIHTIAKRNIANDSSKRLMDVYLDMISSNVMYPLLKLQKGAKLAPSDAPAYIDNKVDKEISNPYADEDDETKKKDSIVIITTRYNLFGSSFLLDFDTLREVRRRFDNSFYVIPLSVDKLMCVNKAYATNNGKKDMFEAEDDLLDMLYEYNQKNKKTDTILSYNIYDYIYDDGEMLIPIKQRF